MDSSQNYSTKLHSNFIISYHSLFSLLKVCQEDGKIKLFSVKAKRKEVVEKI